MPTPSHRRRPTRRSLCHMRTSVFHHARLQRFMAMAVSTRALMLGVPSSRAATIHTGRARMISLSSTLPKSETGVAELLQETPEADGRGTIVAVLDTGCDLAAAGLLKTSDGKPKYVDFLDCTGGGDVDLSTAAKRAEDGTVKGLSGRSLTLGPWAEGIDEFRIGAVRLFSLLPSSVARRVKRERKAAFMAKQHASVTAARRKLEACGKDPDAEAKKDCDTMLAQLNEMMEDYNDHGPLLDVLTFEDPATGDWVAVIDTAAQGEPMGDLSAATPMAPYRIHGQVGDLGWATALSYVVQVGPTLALTLKASPSPLTPHPGALPCGAGLALTPNPEPEDPTHPEPPARR